MNCFSGPGMRAPRLSLPAAIGIFILSATCAAASADLQYDIDYTVTPVRDLGGAWVELKVQQRKRLLRELIMRMPADRISEVSGDGDVTTGGSRLTWLPPDEGGQLRWFVSINSSRGTAYDAYINNEWALFRAEDIIPATSTKTLKGASSNTSIRFVLPDSWSVVTQYAGDEQRFAVDNPERRFDRPTGWIVMGDLGVRTETIAGTRVKIAGPAGQGVRRLDMLALLQWNLAELTRVLPFFPDRLTVVSAGDPMWRGGLSGPMSLFLHSDRPLLSENATSTLLHESVHIGLGRRAGDGADWIVEGVAEYYSLQALRRSGTISERRFSSAMKMQERWGSEASSLCNGNSSGANTAHAVTLLGRLDLQIQKKTDEQQSLDDVIRSLAIRDGPITIAEFRETVTNTMGSSSDLLQPRNLPGCEPG